MSDDYYYDEDSFYDEDIGEVVYLCDQCHKGYGYRNSAQTPAGGRWKQCDNPKCRHEWL